jgi:hypothetical protein
MAFAVVENSFMVYPNSRKESQSFEKYALPLPRVTRTRPKGGHCHGCAASFQFSSLLSSSHALPLQIVR